jgi:putative CRISPR-associated protein (TIGR02619 family)
MHELHVVTVGISLLSNFARKKGISTADAARYAQDLRQLIEDHPLESCAEIASLQLRCGILDEEKEKPAIALVVSHNEQGKCAAGCIAAFLRRKLGLAVTELKMDALDLPAIEHADPDAVQEAMAASMLAMREKVRSHVEKERAEQADLHVQFNMTGGYKAEVAVLYGLGRELDVPVYYLHESYRIPVELP